MSTPTITPTITTESGKQTLNPEFEKARLESPKPGTPAKAGAPAPKADEGKEGKEEAEGHQGLSAGQRREWNRLQRELGESRGREAAWKEMVERGMTPKAAEKQASAEAAGEDPKPDRKAFTDDASFHEALGAWSGRNEAKKVSAADRKENEQQAQLRESIQAASEQAAKDKEELFPDWDEVAKAQSEDLDAPRWQDVSKGAKGYEDGVPVRPTLTLMLHQSPAKAKILYHLAKNPEVAAELIKHGDGSREQILAFHELTGQVKVLYTPKKKEEPKEKVNGSPAEDLAKLHKPSSAVAPKSGGSVEHDIPMMIKNAQGREIINPVWEAARNERAGRRP